MSDLIVIGYDTLQKAQEVRLQLLKMQKEYLIDLEDSVVVFKKEDGKVHLDQAVNLTTSGAARGTFWGLLIGAMFLSPYLGAAVGAASGAISGALSDVGINDAFMKDIGKTLKPGTAALFVLVKSATEDKVAEHIQGTGGKVLKTSLSHDKEDSLQEVLNQARRVRQPN